MTSQLIKMRLFQNIFNNYIRLSTITEKKREYKRIIKHYSQYMTNKEIEETLKTEIKGHFKSNSQINYKELIYL